MPATDAIVAYIDGGSRGNPGPAGFGVHIETSAGALVEELREAVGVATNNVAEYRGLLAALTWALDQGCRHIQIRSDSELLVRQMRGEYRVKNPGLQALHREAREIASKLGRVTFEHIPRSLNQEADRLANLAMDEAAGGVRAERADSRTVGPEPVAPSTSHGPQSSLPFDDELPDNARHSSAPLPTNRKPRRR